MTITKNQHHPLDSSWSGGWKPGDLNSAKQLKTVFRLVFTIEMELGVFTTDWLSLLLLPFLPDKFAFCSLMSILIEIYSRTSTVARLRSQKRLRPKWLPLRSYPVLFHWGPPQRSLLRVFSYEEEVRWASGQKGVNSVLQQAGGGGAVW